MNLSDVLTAIFLLIGILLMLVAAVGIIRMPDLYIRMSAATKASTAGAASLLLAAAFHFRGLSLTTQLMATIAFLLATAPVGAHVIGRAAYRNRKAEIYDQTKPDELRDYYEQTREPFMQDIRDVDNDGSGRLGGNG